MGYRIIYGKKGRCRHGWDSGRTLKTIAVVVGVALVIFWSITGINKHISGEALEDMADAVRNGESVSDAIVTFCQEMIENAQRPQ